MHQSKLEIALPFSSPVWDAPSLLGEALLICRGSRLSGRDWDTTPGNMAMKAEAVSVLSTNGLSITPARSSSPVRALIAQQDSANCERGTAESMGVGMPSRGCPRCLQNSVSPELRTFEKCHNFYGVPFSSAEYRP